MLAPKHIASTQQTTGATIVGAETIATRIRKSPPTTEEYNSPTGPNTSVSKIEVDLDLLLKFMLSNRRQYAAFKCVIKG